MTIEIALEAAFKVILLRWKTTILTLPQWLTLLATVLAIPIIEWAVASPQDIRTFFNWMIMASERGVLHVYDWPRVEVLSRFHDFSPNYPPLVFYLYYPLFFLKQIFGGIPEWPSHATNLLFRMPLYLMHLLVTAQIARLVSKPKLAYLFFGLNPALFLVGPLWGQLDILLWSLALSAVIAIWKGHAGVAGVFAALASLTKPQFLLFTPLFGILFFAYHANRKHLIKFTTSFFVALVTLTLPFTLTSGVSWLTHGYERAFNGEYGLTTTAFNLWWLAGRWLGLKTIDDNLFGVSCKTVGLLLAALAVLPIAYAVLRNFIRKSSIRPVPLFSVYFVALYLFLPGMSARFLVFGLLWTLVWAIVESGARGPAAILTTAQITTLFYNALFLPQSHFGNHVSPQAANFIADAAALASLFAYAWLCHLALRSTCPLLTRVTSTNGRGSSSGKQSKLIHEAA